MIARTWMKLERPSSDAHSDLFGLDWSDDPNTTINSVTERNEEVRGGKESWHSLIPVRLTMCFPSQCVPSILWKRLSSHRAELVFKGANGSHIKHSGQRRFRVKTSAGSNMNTTWEVADVRKPLNSLPPVCLRGSQACSGREAEDPVQDGDTIPLERTGSLLAVRLWMPKGFQRQEESL